jgi:hypothetical protein
MINSNNNRSSHHPLPLLYGYILVDNPVDTAFALVAGIDCCGPVGRVALVDGREVVAVGAYIKKQLARLGRI